MFQEVFFWVDDFWGGLGSTFLQFNNNLFSIIFAN